MEFLRENQLDIMLLLSGVCGAISVAGVMSRGSKMKRASLFLMGISATILLLADRFAYIYRGDTSAIGWWMVRVCNFLVFFLSLFTLHTYNFYLTELFSKETVLGRIPFRLRVTEMICAIGELMVVISQFTHLYYSFDEMNRYQRENGFIISYLIALVIWLCQISVVLQYYKLIDKTLRIALLVFTVAPMIASFMQIFTYGISLTNITLVWLVIILRMIEVRNTNRKIAQADEHEKLLLRQEQENMRTMVMETAYALAEAIEAKDTYTHGHSSRVAQYSEKIARRLGKSEDECRNIYLVALLHDVGKIGIPEQIINKNGKLTDEEFDVIKKHPVIGEQILRKISKNQSLCIGAHYHHERYDGKGYPDGLKGEEIPEIARIVAVADAYDAMTSKRSYRDPLPQDVAKNEILKGMGTQFDPICAGAMLDLIDEDTDYQMREMAETKA